jgi:hypothetical protein
MKKRVLIILAVLLSIPVLLFLTLWLYPRPADTTPAWVFEGDGAELDYCDLPVLDGSGLMSEDIPQAFTPGCGYTTFPQPILRGCTEPLPEGAQDIRGLWQSITPELPDHVERIEQCGDRVVVTAFGLIHDHAPDMLSNDVSPMQIGPWLLCMRTSQATAIWKDKQLHQKLFGGPTVVKRYIEDGVYKWEHPSVGDVEMKRICKVPEHARSFDRSHAL